VTEAERVTYYDIRIECEPGTSETAARTLAEKTVTFLREQPGHGLVRLVEVTGEPLDEAEPVRIPGQLDLDGNV
jgi:hypothetical protein